MKTIGDTMYNNKSKIDINIVNKGTIFSDVFESFNLNDLSIISSHTSRVVELSKSIANKYDEDEEKVFLASLLHDIAGVISNKRWVEFCSENSIAISELERKIPILTHQKISKWIASNVYNITDSEILSAIECHTTLKKNPSNTDLIVFIADKIEWDQQGEPPYKSAMLNALDISLEKSALIYISYVIDNNLLKVPHPWILEARFALERSIKTTHNTTSEQRSTGE